MEFSKRFHKTENRTRNIKKMLLLVIDNFFEKSIIAVMFLFRTKERFIAVN